MEYTSAKRVNEYGGLMVQGEDGVFFYCAPDDEEHAAIVAHFGDDIEPYIDTEPSEEDILAHQVRTRRNAALRELDTVVSNPLRWAEYTAEQQADFATYRQELLDVPQQEGFPSLIDWPVEPEILMQVRQR